MSKYVKDLVVQDLQRRLDGVDDAVLVDVIGLDANTSVLLRKQLRRITGVRWGCGAVLVFGLIR